MLGSLSNGVLTLDPEGRVVKVNAAIEGILRRPERLLVGQVSAVLFSGANSWVHDRINKVRESMKPDISVDVEFELPGEKPLSVNLTVVPLISVKEEPIGTMLVIEDITKEKRLKGTMARYMTKEVAEKLIESGEEMLGGTTQVASVLFSDIRSFTTLSEGMTATEVVSMLNEYFTVMVDIVFQYKGILDKYIGDAIMAVFGPPFASGEDADNSVRAAIEMMRGLVTLNLSLIERGMKPLEIGIGINTDEVLSGNIGSIKRMDYTVIGDGVNLAARLEGANKFYGSKIIVSEFTRDTLTDDFITRRLDNIRVHGKTKPVSIYEVMDFYDDRTFPHRDEVIRYYQEGLEQYQMGDWTKAKAALQEALNLNPDDKATLILLQRCIHFEEKSPGKSWDGVWELESK
jgi:adenylate cyclase